jgi:hypothetical protein
MKFGKTRKFLEGVNLSSLCHFGGVNYSLFFYDSHWYTTTKYTGPSNNARDLVSSATGPIIGIVIIRVPFLYNVYSENARLIYIIKVFIICDGLFMPQSPHNFL